LTATRRFVFLVAMGHVLDRSKQQQVVALGRLGWTLRRIERVTGVRRETASAYLKAAGVDPGPRTARRRRSKSGHFRRGVDRLARPDLAATGTGALRECL
jgi:hypothetical protein